jgi:ubiquinone/menaquinone biosynthesis C-methylase UbiE
VDYQTIYRDHADEYDELVSSEDHEGNLLPALAAVAPIDDATIVDVGTGTGRVARVLLPRAARVIGVEPSHAMLAVARARLGSSSRVELHQGSADALPLPNEVADGAVAGWVFGHLRHWMPEGWRDSISRAVEEMRRVVKPGGSIVIIETLGTGTKNPAPPNDALAEYYAWLEGSMGFRRSQLRTDYAFADRETAARVAGFFFGDKITGSIEATESGVRIPECTGIWSHAK